jgi:hypothetical protein
MEKITTVLLMHHIFTACLQQEAYFVFCEKKTKITEKLKHSRKILWNVEAKQDTVPHFFMFGRDKMFSFLFERALGLGFEDFNDQMMRSKLFPFINTSSILPENTYQMTQTMF